MNLLISESINLNKMKIIEVCFFPLRRKNSIRINNF